MNGYSLSVLCLLQLLTILGGCGSDRPPLGKVSGEVKYAGESIVDGSIVFEVPGFRSASGKIVDGKIVHVTTYDDGDGVPLGPASIAVHAFAVKSSEVSAELSHPGDRTGDDLDSYMGVSKSVIPERYNNPATSGLNFQIERGTNDVVLNLQP